MSVINTFDYHSIALARAPSLLTVRTRSSLSRLCERLRAREQALSSRVGGYRYFRSTVPRGQAVDIMVTPLAGAPELFVSASAVYVYVHDRPAGCVPLVEVQVIPLSL